MVGWFWWNHPLLGPSDRAMNMPACMLANDVLAMYAEHDTTLQACTDCSCGQGTEYKSIVLTSN